MFSGGACEGKARVEAKLGSAPSSSSGSAGSGCAVRGCSYRLIMTVTDITGTEDLFHALFFQDQLRLNWELYVELASLA